MITNIKKIATIFIAFIFCAYGSSSQQKIPENHAGNIADAMRDTLHLNKKQRDKIYAVNMQLFNEKLRARKMSTNRDTVREALQRIENNRDKLYKEILKEDELKLYKQKKKNVINSIK